MRYDICAAHRVRCQAVGDAMVRAISASELGTGTGKGPGLWLWLADWLGKGTVYDGLSAGRQAGRQAA